MTPYKNAICAAQIRLAEDPARRFVGYGIRHGRAGGTLNAVPERQLIETPVAENLMVGMAIGLALRGLKPVVYIERFDFILNAMDAIVNHLDKLPLISHGEFMPKLLIRAVVGNSRGGLKTGITHTQNYTRQLTEMLRTVLVVAPTENGVREAYDEIEASPFSTVIVEYKDLL